MGDNSHYFFFVRTKTGDSFKQVLIEAASTANIVKLISTGSSDNLSIRVENDSNWLAEYDIKLLFSTQHAPPLIRR